MARDLHQSGKTRDSDEDMPEPPQIRRFRRLVSLSMVMMMVGMLGIMVALVWKLTRTDSGPAMPPISAEIDIPEGYDVLSASRTGSQMMLLLENTETGERLVEERNAGNQRVLGRYRLIPVSE